jgi:hypothetical protein
MIAPKLHALALIIGAVAMASSASAASRGKSGYNARAQVIEPAGSTGSEGVSAHRASALRECNTQAGKLVEKDWGVRQSEIYGACMSQHGEPN